MNRKTLYEKVQLLKAGQIVEIENDWFQAVQIDELDGFSCCQLCDLDSICRGDVFHVCCEMETSMSYHWILKLAHPV